MIDHDEPIVSRLRDGLDGLTSTVRTTAPPLDEPNARVTSPAAGGHQWTRLIAAAAVVAALVAGFVWLGRGGDGDRLQSTDAPASTDATVTAPPDGDGAAPGLPVPATPAGWVVVEWGDVRLSLPPSLSPYDSANGCLVDTSARLVVSCDQDSVTVAPIADATRATETVHNGLPAFLDVPTCEGCPVALGLPSLDLEVVARVDGDTALAEQIVASVGVSGRWRASNEQLPAVPPDWMWVERRGIEIAVPPTWRTLTLDQNDADPDVCGYFIEPETVMLGEGQLDIPVDCSASGPVYRLTDGVRIFVDAGAVDADDPAFPAVDAAAPGDGGLTVRVGMGVDSTIGLTILGSIREAVSTGQAD
ncbi:MAG TPA: hypothetical protein VNO51_06550 [Ilumatobacteraceae bacterium]|nr:hypothetical protein [Ilumatobacteraceae bacterium]